ncbi:hypothetical protein EI94DRAFT_1812713 [Lactarius quietus]|nr:hypothetical protein EI94DRAFT_1812713 [Lactarius quietus]
MLTFDIPTGPSITENRLAYRADKRKARRGADFLQRGSITYDREKGEMTQEWVDHNAFLAWLSAEESAKSIELVVSHVARSDTPNSTWRERRVYKCAREYTGGKTVYERVTTWERKVPSKKTGCRCRLTIKRYPHTETILGKYEDKHDHALPERSAIKTARRKRAPRVMESYSGEVSSCQQDDDDDARTTTGTSSPNAEARPLAPGHAAAAAANGADLPAPPKCASTPAPSESASPPTSVPVHNPPTTSHPVACYTVHGALPGAGVQPAVPTHATTQPPSAAPTAAWYPIPAPYPGYPPGMYTHVPYHSTSYYPHYWPYPYYPPSRH